MMDSFRFARHPLGLAISKGKNVRIAPHGASFGLDLVTCVWRLSEQESAGSRLPWRYAASALKRSSSSELPGFARSVRGSPSGRTP